MLLMTMLWVAPRLVMSMGYEGSGAQRAWRWRCRPWPCRGPRPRAAVGQSIALRRYRSAAGSLPRAGSGGWQFERNLRYDATAAQATPDRALARPGIAERFFRMPGAVHDPLAGIVEKELRSLARTPRFRMVFAMGFTFGLAVWFR